MSTLEIHTEQNNSSTRADINNHIRALTEIHNLFFKTAICDKQCRAKRHDLGRLQLNSYGGTFVTRKQAKSLYLPQSSFVQIRQTQSLIKELPLSLKA